MVQRPVYFCKLLINKKKNLYEKQQLHFEH